MPKRYAPKLFPQRITITNKKTGARVVLKPVSAQPPRQLNTRLAMAQRPNV